MKKIISSILAASFILATCAINVMAAPATRKVSVSATPNTDIKPGDEITVTVTLDSDNAISGAGYELTFDSNVFELNTSSSLGKPPKYVDSTWYNAIKGDDLDNGGTAWGVLFGKPTMNQSASSIMFAWSGSEGIPADFASTDFVIGKFTFKVKSDATATSSTINIGGFGMLSSGETQKDIVTGIPATVNFKSAEPTVTPWEVTITEEPKYANGYIWKADTVKGDGNLTKFDVTFTDADSNTLTRSILSSDKSGTFDWNAATTFYVGLKTARTVTAAWDIAAKDGEKDVPVELK